MHFFFRNCIIAKTICAIFQNQMCKNRSFLCLSLVWFWPLFKRRLTVVLTLIYGFYCVRQKLSKRLKIKAFLFGSFIYFLYLCKVNKIFNLPFCNLSEKVANSFGSLSFWLPFLRLLFRMFLCVILSSPRRNGKNLKAFQAF